MPDKDRERFYLSALRKCVPALPEGPVLEHEPPDFVLGSPPRRIGVELTTFHLPPKPGERPHQEIQSLKDRTIDLAEELHARAGGPALYLTAIFGPHGRISKRRVKPLAEELAAVVLAQHMPRSLDEGSVDIPRSLLPREIAHVHAFGSVDGADRLWQADAGGWVAPIEPEHIQAEIDRKARITRVAKERCDALWLVIVHDLFVGAAAAELSPGTTAANYQHPFDRLLWLAPHGPRATDLGVHAV